jgi:UDP-N-acetylmuramoyl-tripeptide--D-alanyl-D-alanine ligase
MAHLWENTPTNRRGAYANTSAELRDSLLSGFRAGDVVMIKGSLGSRMGPLVEAIRARFSPVERET